MAVTIEYVQTLQPIYRDILAAFPKFEPTRKLGYGLAYQSIYSALDGKYPLSAILKACQQMEQGGVVEIRNDIFIHPTDVGEEIISAVSGASVAEPEIPPFSPPPVN